MILYHATTRQALPSILATGLQVQFADPSAKIQAVWLHTSSQSAWALLHTQRKHQVALEDVLIVPVHVPRSRLTRFRTGLWYTTSDVAPDRLGEPLSSTRYSQSASA